MANKHTISDLYQMQSLPLQAKIQMTRRRISEWVDAFGEDGIYVSFSGGKDSTVLKHIVDSMYDDVPSLFVNTGLEYPEIQRFVRDIKNGKYKCFNSDVEIVRPEMRFDEVLKTYGFPVISKPVANSIAGAKPHNTRWLKLKGELINPKNGMLSQFNTAKYGFLLDAPFAVSDKCCDVMKKRPARKYNERTGRKPIIGMLANESKKRKDAWFKTGCNAFELKNPQSQPMAFWTEQDILHYIKKYNVPYASVYGDIVVDEKQSVDYVDGQMNIYEVIGNYEGSKLKTTGCKRTGCIFCMFGCHLEKSPNRFERMKETHPKQYNYIMKPVSDGGLGYKEIIDWINEHGNMNIKY